MIPIGKLGPSRVEVEALARECEKQFDDFLYRYWYEQIVESGGRPAHEVSEQIEYENRHGKICPLYMTYWYSGDDLLRITTRLDSMTSWSGYKNLGGPWLFSYRVEYPHKGRFVTWYKDCRGVWTRDAHGTL